LRCQRGGADWIAMPPSAKIQRWTDLPAALLVRRLPATFEDDFHGVFAELRDPARFATVRVVPDWGTIARKSELKTKE
jgi:hypothetical protein